MAAAAAASWLAHRRVGHRRTVQNHHIFEAGLLQKSRMEGSTLSSWNRDNDLRRSPGGIVLDACVMSFISLMSFISPTNQFKHSTQEERTCSLTFL